MKKGVFKIVRPEGVFEVDGTVSRVFGIHKCQGDKDTWYTVTHRATGKLLTSFSKMKQARAFVTNAEVDPPLPWNHQDEVEMANANFVWVFSVANQARNGLIQEIESENKPLGLFVC